MIYAELPQSTGPVARPLPFYLAMEEHLARNYRQGEFFFIWQVEPTVIFGRCQNPFAEVNLEYCRENGIHTYRRKSGGGCVYADMNNLMFSHITSSDEVTTTFSRYCRMIASTLRKLGLDASATGRNDVLIGDRKVSGNAFYHLHGRSIVHGTMLFDADPTVMAAAITPSEAKLRAKGVASVKSHITTIHDHLPNLTIDDFRSFCRENLCDSTMTMTPADLAEISRIAREYFTDDWIWGRFGNDPADARDNSGCHASRRHRIDGVGEFALSVALTPPPAPGIPPVIRKINLQGDFFLLSDLDESLLDPLIGVEFTYDAILDRLRQLNPSEVIAGLTPESFAGIFPL